MQYFRYITSTILTLSLLACSPIGGIGKRKGDSSPLALYDRTGASSRVVNHEGSQFFITVEAPDDWTLSSDATWIHLTQQQGQAGALDVAVQVDANSGGERVATVLLQTQSEAVRYKIVQQQSPGHTGDSSLGNEVILGDVDLLEVPRLSGRSTSYFITHRVEMGKRVNYSVEYDVEYRHPIWVCYSADDYTSRRATSRTNAWAWDPFVPTKYEVTQRDFSGYSRGHMVASADRLFSEEANIQTFYYTNMSPQKSAHNKGVWLQLEGLVQSWARNSSLRDKIYVVKGGTLRQGETLGKTKGNLTVPEYYWMAILLQRGSEYRAIAFWTEHNSPEKVNRPRELAIPVSVLEKRTGIDFFHNLPDDVERDVESAQPTKDSSLWPGI